MAEDVPLSAELTEELEAVGQVYDDAFSVEENAGKRNALRCTLTLTPEPEEPIDDEHNFAVLSIVFTFRKQCAYPQEAPLIKVQKERGLSDGDIKRLSRDLKHQAEELAGAGECCFFVIAEAAVDFLRERNVKPRSFHEQMIERQHEQDEARKRALAQAEKAAEDARIAKEVEAQRQKELQRAEAARAESARKWREERLQRRRKNTKRAKESSTPQEASLVGNEYIRSSDWQNAQSLNDDSSRAWLIGKNTLSEDMSRDTAFDNRMLRSSSKRSELSEASDNIRIRQLELLVVHLLHKVCQPMSAQFPNAFQKIFRQLHQMCAISDVSLSTFEKYRTAFRHHFDEQILQSDDQGGAQTKFWSLPQDSDGTAPSRYTEDFEELCHLGKGGFGSVTKCLNKIDGSVYAIKKVKLPKLEISGFDDAEDRRDWQLFTNGRILREVALLSRAHHTNVVRYYNAWIEGGEQTWGAKTSVGESEFEEEDTDVEALLRAQAGFGYLAKTPSLGEMLRGRESFMGTPRTSTSIADGRMPQYLYIVMEYCPKSLHDLLYDSDSLEACDEDFGWKILNQLSEGLYYLHSQGIVHRDLKPGNVFIDVKGDIKIGDFGLATSDGGEDARFEDDDDDDGDGSGDEEGLLYEEHEDLAAPRTLGVGTALYRAPELEGGSLVPEEAGAAYDEKVDLFALGVIFMEITYPLTTGHERAKTLMDLRRGVFPDEYAKFAPAQQRVVRWLTSPNPADRPSARELLLSELVPSKKSDSYLEGALQMLTDPYTNQFSRTVDACFSSAMKFSKSRLPPSPLDIAPRMAQALEGERISCTTIDDLECTAAIESSIFRWKRGQGRGRGEDFTAPGRAKRRVLDMLRAHFVERCGELLHLPSISRWSSEHYSTSTVSATVNIVGAAKAVCALPLRRDDSTRMLSEAGDVLFSNADVRTRIARILGASLGPSLSEAISSPRELKLYTIGRAEVSKTLLEPATFDIFFREEDSCRILANEIVSISSVVSGRLTPMGIEARSLLIRVGHTDLLRFVACCVYGDRISEALESSTEEARRVLAIAIERLGSIGSLAAPRHVCPSCQRYGLKKKQMQKLNDHNVASAANWLDGDHARGVILGEWLTLAIQLCVGGSPRSDPKGAMEKLRHFVKRVEVFAVFSSLWRWRRAIDSIEETINAANALTMSDAVCISVDPLLSPKTAAFDGIIFEAVECDVREDAHACVKHMGGRKGAPIDPRSPIAYGGHWSGLLKRCAASDSLAVSLGAAGVTFDIGMIVQRTTRMLLRKATSATRAVSPPRRVRSNSISSPVRHPTDGSRSESSTGDGVFVCSVSDVMDRMRLVNNLRQRGERADCLLSADASLRTQIAAAAPFRWLVTLKAGTARVRQVTREASTEVAFDVVEAAEDMFKLICSK